MNKALLLIVSIVALLTAGCQITQSDKFSPLTVNSNSHTQGSMDETTVAALTIESHGSKDARALKTGIFPSPHPETASSDQTESANTLAQDSDASKETTLIETETLQERIDHALELCKIAQEMWEKGQLEEALSNLDSAYETILEIDLEDFPEFNQQKEDLRFLISKRILEIYASRQIVVNGGHDEIPMTDNQYVKDEIKRLTGPERMFFIQSLERAGRFRPYILSELKKAGLPEELSWLPLIESGFKIRALSPARALGLWQFIPSTGYKFGLNRNYYIDERLDPEKSTKAAISYLKELHNLFGDWTTVLAAYNCGEGRVLSKIRNQKINYLDNFWDLYQQLPRETARYVPRFLATLHIVNHLSDYNITIDNPQQPIDYKSCKIKKQIRLKDIANEIGTELEILTELNPELRYALLPPETYEIKIPVEKADLFLSKLDKIKTSYSPPSRFAYHRVRKGDTLSQIAEKYHTTIRAISSVNQIHKNHTIIAGKVLKIPVRPDDNNSPDAPSVNLEPGQKTTYSVKSGDNLWIIARKFNTTTKQIMTINNLSNTFLHIGQTLVISSDEPEQAISTEGAETYWVKTGDSPFSIAKKHNMSLNRLLALNHLTKGSKIFPGQKLFVE